MFKKFVILLLVAFIGCSSAIDIATISKGNGTSTVSMLERKSRAGLVSFETVGDSLALGLDVLLPFLNVPIARELDVNGNEPALVNINSAALAATGLLAASGAFVSYLFRTYVVFEEKSKDKNRRSDNEFETEFWSMFNNFKLVYKNSSGVKVDTTLSGLFNTIDETFQKNDIDLSSCIQKALCKRIQLSSSRVSEGNSSGVDKIIDGLTSLKWFKHFLRYTTLKDAIDAGDMLTHSNRNQNDQQHIYCDVKYPKCKWSMPEDNLMDIINTYLKFT